MENENNVSIVTNERDYTKAVKISKFNILKRRAAKAEKDIADRLAAEEAALQKEIEESKQNVANAQKETNQDIADMYKSFGYEVPEEYLSSGKTK